MFDSFLAPPISARSSDVENGAALTIGNAALPLTRPQAIRLIDELSRTLAGKALAVIPLDVRDGPRPEHGECLLEAGRESGRLCFAITWTKQRFCAWTSVFFTWPADAPASPPTAAR